MIKELSTFNTACDEFMSGKYILVDAKINSILNIIQKDIKLSNIINSCLKNYDFFSMLKLNSLEKDGVFSLVLPSDEKEIVAFIFSLLSQFKTGDMEISKFIKTYFTAGEEISNEKYSMFVTSIIKPFKDALNNLYEKKHVLVDTSDYQSNYYNKIKTTIKIVFDNLDNYKLNLTEKEEFSMLLNSLYLASEKNDKKLVFSLMIGLDYFTKAHKKTRIVYLSLEECFNN